MSAGDAVSIRRATVADAGAVHALLVDLANDAPAQITFRSHVADTQRALGGEHPAIRALLAECDGRAIGIAVFFLTYSTWYGATGVYIQDLYVSPAARGQRLGERLLEAAGRWGLEHGATHLKLAVDRDNVRAQAFYARCGFEHRDDEMLYMIEGGAFHDLATRS